MLSILVHIDFQWEGESALGWFSCVVKIPDGQETVKTDGQETVKLLIVCDFPDI